MALGENQNGIVPVGVNNKQPQQQIHHQQEQQHQQINEMDQQQQQQHHQQGDIIKTTHDKIAAKLGKQTDANISFLRAARSGDLEKVIEFLESGQVVDINTCNANGLNALHLAAKDGYVDIVSELLRRGANVDNATKKGNTALHIASLAGQKEVIKLLVQYGANVNVQSLNGFTPLYMAAQENHDACVRYLLAKGANPSLATEDGFTPLAVAMQQGHDKVVAVLLENDSRGKVRLPALHIAAKKDDVKAASLLLENEHNPDIVSKSGFTPLHIAAHYGNIDIANLLITKGADVNYTAKHNITPLHVACKWGKTNILQLLLSKGAKIDITTRDGLTPLHCAARSGHEKVIEILLKHNAPILSKTKNGLAPLHMAAQGEHDEAARILLMHKAPVDEVTVDYLTALHVAAHCGHVKVAKLLLDHNADPNARALNGFTPLHIACKKNRIKVVELLLKHNASISATTESGLTPLHVASFMGCMNIVIYLIQNDANPDAPTVRGETPLHLAARANQTDIIRILLRNGAQVDVKAREGQTPLHVASRLGNIDIVMLLLQHGANVDSVTKDLYTPLHIAAKEGQEEVASILIEHNASLDATTKKGFSPLHLAAKYGNAPIAKLLLQKGATVDGQGKNGVTPLHVASHYDHQNVALLLLEKGASPHTSAKNGHTALHIAAKKNQMDIATHLLQYGAKADAESKSGFTPLHLAVQEGHIDMVKLLLDHGANPNHAAKNGLTPIHLAAQEDKLEVGQILLEHGAKIDERTKAGYTPLHVAAHFGQVKMVKFLLENDANIELSTNIGYTPLHQAAQQGHTLIINLLLTHKANPNALTNDGQTALSIANKLGYVTAVETLKVVTETSITNTVTGILEEKYKVVAPESMHETFMSDSEDEGGEDHIDQHQYKYMATDDLKTDTLKYDTTDDSAGDRKIPVSEIISSPYVNTEVGNAYAIKSVDNVNIVRQPVHAGTKHVDDDDILIHLEPHLRSFGGRKKTFPMCRERFLVSFLVDARGGAMRGCRHSGVRVIVPPKSATQPTRITCRYVKPQRIPCPPPLMEGEALVSRVLELSPVEAKFLGPVVLEVPHFGSLREKEREIIILRSDNGETWREHIPNDSEEAVRDVLNETFETNELSQLEDLHTNRIVRIVTHDFPHFFAVVSRIRQEVHAIGSDGGTVSSTAVPQVQAIFPQNALTKKIRVGLQAQPVDLNGCAKLLGQGVAISPVVTVEPRRRKFHKAITLSIPAPQAHTQGMINQYSGNAPTLRLLCSITGGQNRAIWEDVTGSTPLTFVKDSVSFTTTVSARFWLMDCRNIADACRMATELYTYMAQVPFMVKFVVFAKRISTTEAKLSVFCMTDDKEDKTLEHQEYFTEVAKSRDVEILEDQTIHLEFAGNLIPVMKSGDQLNMKFHAFRENRLSFTVRVKDQEEPFGRLSFMNDPKTAKGDPPQIPICTLNVSLSGEKIIEEDRQSLNASQRSLDRNYRVMLNGGFRPPDEIHKADIRLSDICNLLENDWESLAHELTVPEHDIQLIKSEYPGRPSQQAMVMLRLWLRQAGPQATGNTLEQALHKIKRSDIVDKCIFNLELVTDEMEKAVAKMQLDQSGFDNLKEELGPSSRDTSLRRNQRIDQSFNDEKKDEGSEFNGKIDDGKIDIELLKKTLNIAEKRSEHCSTPPPTPIDVNNINKMEIDSDKIPPTAQPEITDFTQEGGGSGKIISTAEKGRGGGGEKGGGVVGGEAGNDGDGDGNEGETIEGIGGIAVNVLKMKKNIVMKCPDIEVIPNDAECLAIQILNELDMAAKDNSRTSSNDNINNDKHGDSDIVVGDNDNIIGDISSTSSGANIDGNKSRIPVKTSTPIKIKTIKKHSKVNNIINKPQQSRPNVGDIEWELGSVTVAEMPPTTTTTTKTTTVQIQDDNDKNDSNGKIKEISTINLENVIRKSDDEHQSCDPVVILSSDDDDDNHEYIVVVDDDTDNIQQQQQQQQQQINNINEAIIIKKNNDNDSNIITTKTITEISDDSIENLIIKTTTEQTKNIVKDGDGKVISTTTTTTTKETTTTKNSMALNDDYDIDNSNNTNMSIIGDGESGDNSENVIIDAQQQQQQQQNINNPNQSESSDISYGDSPQFQTKTISGGQNNKMIIIDNASKTLGSSSDSDIALHEPGVELSEDETDADFYQNNEQTPIIVTQSSVETITNNNDGIILRETTATTTVTNPEDELIHQIANITMTKSDSDKQEQQQQQQQQQQNHQHHQQEQHQRNQQKLQQQQQQQDISEKETMQKVLTQFMTEERKNF